MNRGDFAAGWQPFLNRVRRLAGELAEAFTGKNWRSGALALASVGVAVALYGANQYLYAVPSPSRMMNMEFAGNAHTAAAIALSWREAKVLPYAWAALLLNSIFVICYTAILARLCCWASERLHEAEKLQISEAFSARFGKWLTEWPSRSGPKRYCGLPSLAATFALLRNTLLACWLILFYFSPYDEAKGALADRLVGAAYLCATLNFGLLAVCIFFFALSFFSLPFLRGFVAVLKAVRIGLTFAVLLPLILMTPPSRDALRAMAENAVTAYRETAPSLTTDLGILGNTGVAATPAINVINAAYQSCLIAFVVAALLYPLMLWYQARLMVQAAHPIPMEDTPSLAELDRMDARDAASSQTNHQVAPDFFDRAAGERHAAIRLPRWCAYLALIGIGVALFAATAPPSAPPPSIPSSGGSEAKVQQEVREERIRQNEKAKGGGNDSDLTPGFAAATVAKIAEAKKEAAKVAPPPGGLDPAAAVLLKYGLGMPLIVLAPLLLAVVFSVGRDWQMRYDKSRRTPPGPHGPGIVRQAVKSLTAVLNSDDPARPPSWNSRLLFLALFVPGLTLFAIAGQGPEAAQWATKIGAPACLMIGFGLIVPVVTLCGLAQRRTRFPFLLALLTLWGICNYYELNDNHQVRMALRRDEEMCDTKTLAPDMDKAFQEWLQNRPDRDRFYRFVPSDPKTGAAHWEGKYPVFFVAAEGGGIRAAYQAAIALAACQDKNPNFADHVFLLSGVSGGSLGEAVFAGLCRRYLPRIMQDTTGPDGKLRKGIRVAESDMQEQIQSRSDWQIPLKRDYPRSWVALSDRILGYDMLAPVITQTFSPDFVQRFLPYPVGGFDRARALEVALETSFREATGGNDLAASFYAFHKPDVWNVPSDNGPEARAAAAMTLFARASVPALFFNATNVETGDRLVISSLLSNEHWRSPSNRLHGEGEGKPYVTTLADINRHADPPLSTAACLSARFPIVSSAGWIPVTEMPDKDHTSRSRPLKRRFVDGGYFENSGLATVDDALTALAASRRGRPNSHERLLWRPIVIRIGNEGKFAPESADHAPEYKEKGIMSAEEKNREAEEDKARKDIRENGSPLNSDSFEDYLSPILAFGNAWGARNMLGINQMRVRHSNTAAVANARSGLAQIRFLQFVYFDEAGHDALPLSWQLSAVSRRELFRQTGVEIYETVGAQQARQDSPAERNAETLSVISRILQGGETGP